MKIAICISGFTRQYIECFQYYQKYVLDPLKNHDLDVFFHGWYNAEDDNVEKTYNTKACVKVHHSAEKMQEIKDAVGVGYISNLNQSILKNALKTNITGMFYNIYYCNELKKEYAKQHDIHYDITIHTRPDNVFFNPLTIGDVHNKIQFGGCQSLICDHFFYGTSENMDKVASIYTQLKDLFKENIRGIGAEHLLHHYISKCGMLPVKGNGLQHAVYYMAKNRHAKKMNI